MLVVSGLWTLLGVTIDVVPVLCITAGLALLVSAVARAPRAPRAPGGHARTGAQQQPATR